MKKFIYLVEDRDGLRKSLHEMFEDRGFRIQSSGTAGGVREFLKTCLEPPDVIILDMHLGAGPSGGELGLEICERFSQAPPEVLIYSAYDDQHYYKLALRLRATYLNKQDSDRLDLLRYARVLAARHPFRLGWSKFAHNLDTIAEQSSSATEAIRGVCEEYLYPALKTSLGGRFQLLLTHQNQSCFFGTIPNLPEVSSIYSPLSRILNNLQGPTEVNAQDLSNSLGLNVANEAEIEILEKLQGTVFVNLYSTKDTNLSLGIYQEKEPDVLFPENAMALAKVMQERFKPTLMESLFHTVRLFSEKEIEKKKLMEATARFCFYVGQAQRTIYKKADQAGEITPDAIELPKLMELSGSLQNVSNMLHPLFRGAHDPDEGSEAMHPISITELLRFAWDDLKEREMISHPDNFQVQGDCTVQGNRSKLLTAVSHILQWFALRMPKSAGYGHRPELIVICNQSAATVIFEDNSPRLPETFRENLFAPFSTPQIQVNQMTANLGLYVAKVMIEVANHGSLEERSDELPEEWGHRLVMKFPHPARDYGYPQRGIG
ncbi:MAG: response regulator [Acidobacteriota bacterium]|nr:response regulator [Acidobacteriota bacterium]